MTADTETRFTCANCEADFAWLPLVHHGLSFCCPGCAVGGPCSCSYEEHPRPAVSGALNEVRPLPMTAETWQRVSDEADRLFDEIGEAKELQHRDFGRPGDPERRAVPAWEIERAEARLTRLHSALARAEIVNPDGAAVVGARVTLRRLDDGFETFAIVPPGHEDATLNRVSPDSPFGRSLLWLRTGAVVTVALDGRTQSCTVESVTYAGAVGEGREAVAVA